MTQDEQDQPQSQQALVSREASALRSRRIVRFYRAAVALTGWLGILLLWAQAVLDRPPGISPLGALLSSFRYFTVQSNVLVLIWLLLAVIYWQDLDAHLLLRPLFKGAFTVYISVTFLVFIILLQPLYHPQGISRLVNTLTHYVTPVAFMVDFLLFERGRSYPWRYAAYWLIYPAAYLVFALAYGSLTGDYIYPFLDVTQLGTSGLAAWIAILSVLFVLLGAFYIGASKVWLRWATAQA